MRLHNETCFSFFTNQRKEAFSVLSRPLKKRFWFRISHQGLCTKSFFFSYIYTKSGGLLIYTYCARVFPFRCCAHFSVPLLRFCSFRVCAPGLPPAVLSTLAGRWISWTKFNKNRSCSISLWQRPRLTTHVVGLNLSSSTWFKCFVGLSPRFKSTNGWRKTLKMQTRVGGARIVFAAVSKAIQWELRQSV